LTGLLDAIVELLEARSVDLEAWALAWARVLPFVMVVPAFGARLLPGVARVVLGLSLAFVIAPSVTPVATSGVAWPFALVTEALRGLPVALGAAALMWAASMAGGLADELRGAGQSARLSMLEPETPALGVLFGLFAALGFISLGGVSRTLEHLLTAPLHESWALGAVRDLVGSAEIAVALAAPVLGLVVVAEVAGALVARSATPAHIRPLLAPLRALFVLFGLALALDGMFRWLLDVLA